MSSLRNILNPEDGRRLTIKLVLNTERNASTSRIPSSPASCPASDTSENVITESGEDLPRKNHEFHLDCPDSLACLSDTDGRPQHTLPVILRCAILGSPQKRLTIREIYAAMEEKYSYYKTAGSTWKQSVRHHLSLNRLFERQPRPVTDPGFGSYWTVNLAAPPGTKRPRKRGRPNKDAADTLSHPPKKRGRPRKFPLPSEPDELEEEDGSRDELDGREGAEVSPCRVHDTSRADDDFDDDKLEYEEVHDIIRASEEEYESEEEMIHPLDRRNSLVGLSSFTSSNSTQPFSLPPFSSLRDGSDDIINRMQSEIASLRCQSAEAVSLSLRLSEQLAHAQAEASRMRAALRTAESMMENEGRKRREAERAADNEEKRRCKAEEVLRVVLSRSSND
ncbi:hypothetical protein L208DRAFT_1407259 [Tricholoma matsutake]|nr:hypothetical protein L208DRAFT_1407259 [Tricholoma matsutake 945]